MAGRLNLAGQKFGRYTVTDKWRNAGPDTSRRTEWLCVCECKRRVWVSVGNLRSGRATQCAYCQHQMGYSKKHGMSGTREYGRWHKMKSAGLLCREWAQDLMAFLNATGKPPRGHFYLVPLNGNRVVGPGNFQWSPIRKPNGIPAKAAALGISHQAIHSRLAGGWTWDEATTLKKGNRPERLGEWRNGRQPIQESEQQKIAALRKAGLTCREISEVVGRSLGTVIKYARCDAQEAKRGRINFIREYARTVGAL